MLLGSPPDMVHGFPLRGTGLSSPLTRGRRHSAGPGAGIHPCCSGLQVQGTANSPTSAVLLRAGPSGPGPSRYRLLYYILRNLSIPDFCRTCQDVAGGIMFIAHHFFALQRQLLRHAGCHNVMSGTLRTAISTRLVAAEMSLRFTSLSCRKDHPCVVAPAD